MSNERIYYSHDAEVQAMRDRAVLALFLLVFGLAVGGVLAVLFAPTSGKETRHELAKNVEDGLNTGRDTVEPVLKRLEEECAELRKHVEDRLK